MKNKGLIKFLAWLFGLVCIFQLVLTFQFNQIENRADDYTINLVDDSEENFDTKRRDLKLKYLDSISNISALFKDNSNKIRFCVTKHFKVVIRCNQAISI